MYTVTGSGDRHRHGILSSAQKNHSTAKKQPPLTKPKPAFLSARKIFESGNAGPSSTDQQNKENVDPLEVYCRIRPLKSCTDLVCVKQVKENVIQLVAPGSNRPDAFYTFKDVFDEKADQKAVFQQVCLPMVEDLLNGKNGLLFTYGVTSSGKTHTLTGRAEDPGILPRTLDTLFNSIKMNLARKFSFKSDGQNGFIILQPADALMLWQAERAAPRSTPATPYAGGRTAKQRKQEAHEVRGWASREKDPSAIAIKNSKNLFSVFISYFEVYNNYVYDLLDENILDQIQGQQRATSKALREDVNKRIFVLGCKEIEVMSSEDAFEVFLKGLRRRKMAHTALNTESSRSHSVFNIRVVQSPMDDAGEISMNSNIIHVSQLSLVDLAGSERTLRSGTTGERLREAGNINNSLMSLRNCLDILRENQKNGSNKVVPYRENKLTHLFKTYFEGEGKVKMVICINPSTDEYDESVHVLKFAETTQEVMITRGNEFAYKLPPTFLDTPTSATAIKEIHFASLGNFGPPAPTSLLSDLNNEKVIPEWLEYLQDHKRIRSEKTSELLLNQMIFREQLANLEKEVVILRNEKQTLVNDLAGREAQVSKMEFEVAQTQRTKEATERKNISLTKEVESLQKQLAEMKTNQSSWDKEKAMLKEKYMEALRVESMKMKRAYENKLMEKESELKKRNCLNQEKLHLVHDILFRNEDIRSLQDHIRPPSSPPASGSSGTAPKAPSTPNSPSKRTRRNASQDREVNDRRSAPQSPITAEDRSPEKGPPVINPRHRRSLSSGQEKWLDHRPPGTLELGTVLQPKIKNKKSFTNLKEVTTEMFKSASNYALTHHSADATGEVETKVYKGDIIPSLGGGAHVVFNDVETLTQDDPMSPNLTRKRAVSDSHAIPSTPTNSDGNDSTLTYTKRSRR